MLRELFTAVPVPVAYLAGPELVFEFANDAYRRLVGRQELVGRPVGEALPELVAQGRVGAHRRACWSPGSRSRVMRPSCSSPGTAGPAPSRSSLSAFTSRCAAPDEAADGVLLLLSDVTAQVLDRRAQEALAIQLAATQERYRTLFETLPQGVIYYDTNGLILGANPAACQTLGLDEDELITWPLIGSTQAVHEDGSAFLASELPVAAGAAHR